ncbi:MAG: SBBP repeat-containing protein [Bacteroidota bacterium]
MNQQTIFNTFPIFVLLCLSMLGCQKEKMAGSPNENPPDTYPIIRAAQITHSTIRPTGFTENQGQLGAMEDVKFYLKKDGVGCYVKSQGISYIWSHPVATDSLKGTQFQSQRLDLTWVGAQMDIVPKGIDANSALQNFYTEAAPAGIIGVKSYQKLRYENLYPNIDLLLYIQADHLKYDFIVKPGGSVSDIKLQYDGEADICLEPDGSLLLTNSLGTLKEGSPFTYQEKEGTRIPVEAHYQLQDSLISFQIGAYDCSSDLIIDPDLMWSTYLGGDDEEEGRAVCTDSKGNVYIAGRAFAHHDELATLYELQEYWDGDDAFLAKFAPTGALLWTTYYGGGDEDEANAVCTDPDNNVFLAGFTHSHNGIAYNGHDEVYNEFGSTSGNRFDRDAFLVKFDEDGQREWGTYYGGEEYDGYTKAEEGRAVCTNENGDVFLAGFTSSEMYIAFDGYDNTYAGSYDAFLVKFDGNGNREWATYFGNEQREFANAVAVNPAGEIYMAGLTESEGIASGGHDNTYSGNMDAFMVKYTPDGDRLWATYYGSNGVDQAHSLATHQGFVYMAGVTSSANSIAHNGHDMSFNGGVDAFLVKFNMFGGREWGTYFGGPDDETVWGGFTTQEPYQSAAVSVSKFGDVYLSGTTESNSGIAHLGYDNTLSGTRDGFLARFLHDGSRQWATYFGGNSNDYIYGVANDVAANVYVVGKTYSNTDIAHKGHDESYGSGGDAFLAKFKPYKRAIDDGPGDLKDEPDNPHESPEREEPKKDPRDLFSSNSTASFSLYPNPSLGVVHVRPLHPSENTYQIHILDAGGKRVFHQEDLKGANAQQLDLSSLPRGTYFLKLVGEQVSYTQKLILK